MSEDDKERQENELLVLESIFDSKQFFPFSECSGGQVSISLAVPDKFKVLVPVTSEESALQDQIVPDTEDAKQFKEIAIQYLPPIGLNFSLPSDYPSASPPTYSLSCKWLNVMHLSQLCNRLDEEWINQGPGCEILYEWIQILTEQTLSILNITATFNLSVIPRKYKSQGSVRSEKLDCDSRAYQDIESVESLVAYLVDYDTKEQKEQFAKTYFDCGVCFLEKIGSKCISFPKCKHVFCAECITEYFQVQIKDGSVRALTCPEGKCDVQADPGLVKKLVPKEVFERYDKFLLQTTLECMDGIFYCPIPSCQSPVLKEENENLARCPSCNFTFCVLCKRTYHGVAPCKLSDKELLKVRTEYMEGNEGTRAALEKRYGKKRLQYMVEEVYSEKWLDTFAKSCPSCGTHIQKIDGCNKLNCFKCRKNFCWLCLKVISTADPYLHFNDTSTGCFNQLFQGVVMDVPADIDDEDDEDGWIQFVF